MKIVPISALALRACALAISLSPAVAIAQAPSASEPTPGSSVVLTSRTNPADDAPIAEPLRRLLAEAVQNNPEVRAARKEQEAASERVAPAGALDDPMLEAGILNLPASSFSFGREDMTMLTVGVMQDVVTRAKRDAASARMHAEAARLSAERMLSARTIRRDRVPWPDR